MHSPIDIVFSLSLYMASLLGFVLYFPAPILFFFTFSYHWLVFLARSLTYSNCVTQAFILFTPFLGDANANSSCGNGVAELGLSDTWAWFPALPQTSHIENHWAPHSGAADLSENAVCIQTSKFFLLSFYRAGSFNILSSKSDYKIFYCRSWKSFSNWWKPFFW